MTIDGVWEERSAVVASVSAAGLTVSESQLARLHRAGAIFPPERRALGRGAGRPSWYPPGTTTRVIRLLQLADEERRLARRAWRAWWYNGGQLVPAVRRLLMAVADDLDAELQVARRLAQGQAEQDPEAEREADAIFEAAEHDRLAGPLARARHRVGKHQFPVVLQFLIEVAGGRFADYDHDNMTGESLGPLIEKALGFERARSDTLSDARPWLQGDTAPDFAKLSRHFADLSFRKLAGSSSDVLDAARREVRAFTTTVTAAGEMMEHVFGRDAFGYGTFARELRLDSFDTQGFLLLGWVQLGSDPETRQSMEEFVQLESEAVAGWERMTQIDTLRRAVPGFAQLPTPESIGAALKDAGKAEELDAALTAARQGHESEIDAIFGVNEGRRA
jgi:hypothetical protein